MNTVSSVNGANNIRVNNINYLIFIIIEILNFLSLKNKILRDLSIEDNI